jgi:hypothetical protein
MKRAWTIGLTTVFVMVLVVLYAKANQALAGKPRLTKMNSQALSALQADFNRETSNVRVILLLSPT